MMSASTKGIAQISVSNNALPDSRTDLNHRVSLCIIRKIPLAHLNGPEAHKL